MLCMGHSLEYEQKIEECRQLKGGAKHDIAGDPEMDWHKIQDNLNLKKYQ